VVVGVVARQAKVRNLERATPASSKQQETLQARGVDAEVSNDMEQHLEVRSVLQAAGSKQSGVVWQARERMSGISSMLSHSPQI
jgi:hypothetical protein